MTKYELVCVIDAGMASADIKALRSKIEGWVTVLDTDDIGLLPTAYPIAGQDQAYYVSYYVEVDPTTIDGVKQKMRLEQGLARYVFYTMKDDQKFLKYADLQKQYTDILDAENAEREAVETPSEEQEEETIAVQQELDQEAA